MSVVYTSNNGTIEGFSIDSKVLNAYNLANGTNLTTSDPIRFITKNGTIQLVDHLPGDVNSDGVVDILDALHLSHTIVYEKQTEEINKYGDVNLSGGNANVSDVVDILQSLTGAYGTNLLYHEYKLVVNTNGYVNIPSANFVQLYGENCTYDKILTDEINSLMKQREGYKFLGWFTRLENGTEIKLSDVIKYDPNQKIQTVYARWEKNSVSFDMNGATSEKLEGLAYGGNDRYITLTTPEEKYTITFTDPNNAKNSKTSTMSHKFSHWVLLDKNGSEMRIYNVGDKFDINEANLGKVTLKAIWGENDGWTLDVPTLEKTGYDSNKIDWYSDVFCSDKIDVSAFETIKTLSNKVLYADWTTPITYTVTYDLGNGSTNTVTVTYGNYVHIPIPDKEGYTFNGWTITGAEGISSSDATKEDFLNLRSTSGTVVMAAKFTKNSYNVQFNLNDGKLEGIPNPMTCGYGDVVTIPNPTREGYNFAGWTISGMDAIVHTYGSSTSSATSLSGITATTFKNLRGDDKQTVTFTASWTGMKYNITYNLNEANTSADQDKGMSYSTPSWKDQSPNDYVIFGTTGTYLDVPEAAYYKFEGWYTDKFSGAQITDEYGKIINATQFTYSTTLYAHWSKTEKTASGGAYVYVKTPKDLENMGESGNYLILDNINMEGATWIPKDSFSGEIDGDGHCIYNFSISKTGGSGTATIAFIKNNTGTIKDLIIGKTGITTYDSTYSVKYNVSYTESGSVSYLTVGGFVGENSGTISGCKLVNTYINATFADNNNNQHLYLYVGGIATINSGTITNCHVSNSNIDTNATCPKESGDNNHAWLGGICGKNSGTLSQCTVKATTLDLDVRGDGFWDWGDNNAYPWGAIGGIVGEQLQGTTTGCTVSGNTLNTYGSSGKYTKPTIHKNDVCGLKTGGTVS